MLLLLKHKNVQLAWRVPYLCNVSSQRKYQIKLTHYNVAKKIAHYSQIVRAKENLKWTYGGPSKRQTSGANLRIKALRQGGH